MEKVKLWTQEEDKYILENQGKMTYREMAKKIGRTESAVKNRISYERMKSHMNKDKAKEWLEEQLPGMTPQQGKRQIMKKLNIDEKKAEKVYNKWRKNYIKAMM
ncbi:hypothetical protein [Clostridium tetani]|uniref:hypothetical protein n=1 Tax=Clostridium tetani TaxID=1513 RepID=UPI0029529715|nr:hypothetical protein [Clostridium tetani]BDR63992.1 hypothetical protein K134307016_09260 [Clostridium tetani]BDR77987.1 hypothetical protein K154307017_09200 [Clostridium tetani]